MNDLKKPIGVLGHFHHPDDALEAAKAARDAKIKHFDLLTPFPVHGMDEAMGLKRSWVPWIAAGAAITGILTAQAMMVYIMVFDWPMNYGGKPFFAWPDFIPITFELMVLFAGLASAAAAILGGKKDNIPQPPPCTVYTGATRDRFVLWISATDPDFDLQRTLDLMTRLNALGVRAIDREGNDVA